MVRSCYGEISGLAAYLITEPARLQSRFPTSTTKLHPFLYDLSTKKHFARLRNAVPLLASDKPSHLDRSLKYNYHFFVIMKTQHLLLLSIVTGFVNASAVRRGCGETTTFVATDACSNTYGGSVMPNSQFSPLFVRHRVLTGR
jgi:hypothetical protein